MTQFKGTGKDPAGRYPAGQVFDVPEAQAALGEELVEKGYAELVGDQVTDKRKVEVANAVVRGDALGHPHDQKVAAAIDRGDASAHDIVHSQDAKAKAGESELSDDEAADRSFDVEPLAETTPQRAGETGGQTAQAGGKK